MQYLVETSLSEFDFSNQARENAKLLSAKQLDEFEDNYLSDFFGGNTPTETDIDDLFKYNFEDICESLGLVYTDDLEVVDDPEEWIKETIEKNKKKEVVDSYLYAFILESSDQTFNSKEEILKAFDEYVSENSFKKN